MSPPSGLVTDRHWFSPGETKPRENGQSSLGILPVIRIWSQAGCLRYSTPRRLRRKPNQVAVEEGLQANEAAPQTDKRYAAQKSGSAKHHRAEGAPR